MKTGRKEGRNKRSIVYSFKAILFGNTKTWTRGTHNNMHNLGNLMLSKRNHIQKIPFIC